jgi:GT2 family glycosyltransferase
VSGPSVAVVVLNWNGKEYLTDCLASLRQQTYPGPRQLVVVDNGSEDGSASFVQGAFPEVRVIRSAVNLGFSAGNNLAARQLDTELVAFLNNDTRADPRWLEELVIAVTGAPDVACAGGKILSWDGGRLDFGGGGATLTGFGLQLGFGEPATDGDSDKDMLFACGGSMIVKRRPYLEVGGLDDDYFLFYEDVDLGWRFWLAGHRVRYAPRSVVYHRHHGATRRWDERRLAVLYERNALYTIYKNYDDEHLTRVLPAALLLAAERAAVLAGVSRSPVPGSPRRAVALGGVIKPTDWKKLGDSIRRRGMVGTVGGLWTVAAVRIRPRFARFRARLGRWVSGDRDAVAVSPAAISRLQALEEFGANLPALQEKRRAVQALRRRTDAEILELFITPLDPGFDGPGFNEYHQRLLKAFRLDQWVAEGTRRKSPDPHA